MTDVHACHQSLYPLCLFVVLSACMHCAVPSYIILEVSYCTINFVSEGSFYTFANDIRVQQGYNPACIYIPSMLLKHTTKGISSFQILKDTSTMILLVGYFAVSNNRNPVRYTVGGFSLGMNMCVHESMY